jgi:hypothetical protein
MDNVFITAIVPAIRACGLNPIRVDKHNNGGLLKSEIIKFIESSDLIIADLTNERPNCYLEVGYTMGLDKYRSLILTVREDHHQDSPKYKKGGPKVHFDLIGYDILFWEADNLNKYKEELETRIRRRLATLTVNETEKTSMDYDWFEKNRIIALEGLKKQGKKQFMEAIMFLENTNLNLPQTELLNAASKAEIHTFGWPLGIVLNKEEYKPKPRTDGIYAEIITERNSYDYWAIKKNGYYYLINSLFEEERKPGYIFFNTRIVRITEMLLYAVRLYTTLKVPMDSKLILRIKHSGLKDSILYCSNPSRMFFEEGKSSEDEVVTEIETTLEKIESDLVNIVKRFVDDLLIVFDFFKISDEVLKDIVDRFVKGEVT